jgi:N-acetylmuramoyl-L-alanine amidase
VSESHIRDWQKIIAVGIDGDFGPATLAASKKVAEQAGIIKPVPPPVPGKITGKDFLDLAATRIGEEYVYGADVDLDDKDWHGPWDCAEFVTWVVKQLTGKIYGCVNNHAADPDPYTGGWKQDVESGSVNEISIKRAIQIPGAILLRYRQNGKHIVFSKGNGSTIEAKGRDYGVCEASVVAAASWDYGILISGVIYRGWLMIGH